MRLFVGACFAGEFRHFFRIRQKGVEQRDENLSTTGNIIRVSDDIRGMARGMGHALLRLSYDIR